MNKAQKDFYKLFSEHGHGESQVVIQPQEVLLLLYIAYKDLFDESAIWFNKQIEDIANLGFYHITSQDIENLPKITEEECYDCMQKVKVTDVNNIAYLYFKCLCVLYRRRIKFYHILQNQPFPNSDQIVPRCLLEYGNCNVNLLANWLEWRKWIYDIDNRSAQETGYLFEPILASCLGGEFVSAANSPIKRINDRGQSTNQGRQIDCYLSQEKEAYELKMRVTTAASGQGRFKEELSFAQDAKHAGIIPILVVFDENASVSLTKLKNQFIENGGKCYIGHEAWKMLMQRAGEEMGRFIQKYIYPPIHNVENMLGGVEGAISLRMEKGQIVIASKENEYIIKRK